MFSSCPHAQQSDRFGGNGTISKTSRLHDSVSSRVDFDGRDRLDFHATLHTKGPDSRQPLPAPIAVARHAMPKRRALGSKLSAIGQLRQIPGRWGDRGIVTGFFMNEGTDSRRRPREASRYQTQTPMPVVHEPENGTWRATL